MGFNAWNKSTHAMSSAIQGSRSYQYAIKRGGARRSTLSHFSCIVAGVQKLVANEREARIYQAWEQHRDDGDMAAAAAAASASSHCAQDWVPAAGHSL